MQLLINHIGYECFANKSALILAKETISATIAEVINCQTGKSVMQLPITQCGAVDQWQISHLYQLDFSALTACGDYCIQVGDTVSPTFSIAQGLLFDRTFSDVIHYFKSQRSSGIFDAQDQQANILGSARVADVHGGWYDASGDVSKYLSHLSYANYLNPQQIPMVVWNMLAVLDNLSAELVPFTRTRLLDEALFGADFLVRMQDPDGYFYLTVFDQWSKDPAQREICAFQGQNGNKSNAYQAGFRQGAGIAIAALAEAARCGGNGEYDTATYQKAAETGYWHLKEHNAHYLDDGIENILDFYCALMAATALSKLTQNSAYLTEARYWATRLAEQQHSDPLVANFWSATDDGSRPYFHAAEAGLPAISLMQYLQIENDIAVKTKIEQILINALTFELTITEQVTNPFGYPRQYIKNVDATKRTSFFIAQRNESGYWWQGENARLGSLASMAFMAIDCISDPKLKIQLADYGQHALNWIMGLNPYDMCMLDGHGRNNPDYLPQLGFINAKGGICNGVTAGFENEHDIAFNPPQQKNDMLQNWRWGEQWIPHAAWYLLAIALQKKALTLHQGQGTD